ncbi:MAG: EAL domain-containing protein [Geminicoccaceae bacterium]
MSLLAGRERSMILAGAALLPALLLLALHLPGAPLWFALLAASQIVPAALHDRRRPESRAREWLDLQTAFAGFIWGAGAAWFHGFVTFDGHSLLPLFVASVLALALIALDHSPRRRALLLFSTGTAYAGSAFFLKTAQVTGITILSVTGLLIAFGLLTAIRPRIAFLEDRENSPRQGGYRTGSAQEELARTVQERTRELREANSRLSDEIETRQRSEDRIRFLLEHDSLTGLPNRLLLMRKLEEAVAGCEEKGGSLSVMMLDLDGFKQINDTFGHPAGDRLLRLAAGRLTAAVDSGSTVARMGGDEFAILAPGTDSSDSAGDLAGRILQGFASPFDIDGNRVHVLASIGIALCPENGGDAETLLLRADQSLYEAKSFGRGRYSIFSQELQAEQQNRSRLERELRAAIDEGQLHLCFQPRYTLSGQALVAVEALLRWRHPTLGLLFPADFLPLAEKTGLIGPIGRWVLSEASTHARLWQNSGLRTRVAVNMSVSQLHQHDIARQILEALDRAGLTPERLEIEISEPAISNSGPGLVSQLQRIKGLGVHLVLDNFGTGAASLERIKNLPFDRLKIDGRFVRGMQADPADWAVVKSAITLARGMGWTSIAEGVEEEAQLDGLLALGCDEAQGYLLGQPMEIEEIEPVLGA